jgi:hypothetical protein
MMLSTMTIKVGSFARVNDIAELENNISCILDSHKEEEVKRYVKEHCGFISFSINKEMYGPNRNPQFGYLIPSMWGIYADKSQGACLVLDEELLKSVNAKVLSEAKWHNFVDIGYTPYQGLKLANSKEKPLEIIQKDYNHILCTKHASWGHEQERRFVGVDTPHTLSLKGGVIRGIIIGQCATDEHKEQLLSVLDDPNLACYGQLDKKIFVKQIIKGTNVYTTYEGRYFAPKK